MIKGSALGGEELEGAARKGSTLLLALIHPSAWNRISANFALTEFSDVRSPLGFVTLRRR
jgi:hypothetical protein